MSGIINYFHSESGTVIDCWWELSDKTPAFCIEIVGNPHRTKVWDYGADIGVDPSIAPGDEVIYLRLEDTTGIWVQSASSSAAELSEAIARVMANRCYIERWRSAESDAVFVEIAREIYEARGEPLRVTSTEAGKAALTVVSEGWATVSIIYGGDRNERPKTSASFFLSHAAEDALLARRIFEDLTSDAGVDVWFDLAQPAQEVPTNDTAIAEWLRKSIHVGNGFVVLWTEHAAQSDWVKREVLWADELRKNRSGFDTILLKLRDVEVPAELSAKCLVIDCNDIWWSNGLNEELYAAVFRRESRRVWLASLPPTAPVSKGTMIGYSDFVSDSGVVVKFDWAFDQSSHPESLRWQLDYRRKDGTQRHVTGGGSQSAVDLAMKPGDPIGFFKVRWRHGSHFLAGPELWMRSKDLGITSDIVLDQYYETLRRGPQPETPV